MKVFVPLYKIGSLVVQPVSIHIVPVRNFENACIQAYLSVHYTSPSVQESEIFSNCFCKHLSCAFVVSLMSSNTNTLIQSLLNECNDIVYCGDQDETDAHLEPHSVTNVRRFFFPEGQVRIDQTVTESIFVASAPCRVASPALLFIAAILLLFHTRLLYQ